MATNASGTATAGPMIAPRFFLPGTMWDAGDRLVAVTDAADTEEVEMIVLTAVASWLITKVTTLTLRPFVFDEGPLTVSDCGIRLEEGVDVKEEKEVDEEDTAAEVVEDGEGPCGNIDLRLSSEKREFDVSQQA